MVAIGEIGGGTSLNSLLAVCRLSYIGFGENISWGNAMETEKVASHLTAKIVRSYVRHHTVGAAQLSDLITTVHRALGELGQPYHPEEVRTPAVWFAWIVATGGKRYAGILAHGTA